MEKELWKPIENYNGKYEISTTAKVRNTFTGRILKQQVNDNNYCSILLRKEGVRYKHLIHRLVALAFIPNPDNKPHVNHIKGKSNHVSNLEWSTVEENNLHAQQTGLILKGEEHGRAILTDEKVLEIIEFLKKGVPSEYIMEKYGISFGALTSIKSATNWRHLNSTPIYRKSPLRLSLEQLDLVDKLLAEGKNIREIHRETGIARETIRKIKNNEYKEIQRIIRRYFCP